MENNLLHSPIAEWDDSTHGPDNWHTFGLEGTPTVSGEVLTIKGHDGSVSTMAGPTAVYSSSGDPAYDEGKDVWRGAALDGVVKADPYKGGILVRSPDNATIKTAITGDGADALGRLENVMVAGDLDQEHQLTEEPLHIELPSQNAAEWGNSPSAGIALRIDVVGSGTVEIAAVYLAADSDAVTVPEWPAEEDPGDPGDPVDPGDLDEWDALATQLAPRVARYVARRGDEEATELAADQLPMILSFVYGYTRGKGFSTEELPTRDLRAVIVSAAARALVNPEQLQQFSSGDYSETSPRLTGFTLMERRVLNNYRRVWA